jgi:hypothetical protein
LIGKQKEPNNFENAKNQSMWCKAMNEELDALEKDETWKIVLIPNEKKSVGCNWLHKIKYHYHHCTL